MLFRSAVLITISIILTGCSGEPPEISPMPAVDISKNTEISITQAPTAESNMIIMQLDIKKIEPLDELSNQGSNIENGGYVLKKDNIIYYQKNGLFTMSPSGNHIKKLLEQDDTLYLNIYKDYLYYISANDYNVYRFDLVNKGEPELLGLNGAYSLVIIGDYIYYQNAIGEDADFYIYRADIKTLVPENLMIKTSSFCTDGQNIYYANSEDENKLYEIGRAHV